MSVVGSPPLIATVNGIATDASPLKSEGGEVSSINPIVVIGGITVTVVVSEISVNPRSSLVLTTTVAYTD